jgi:hypothetical protein
MSTTLITAGQVMDRVANFLNDPNKTDYTYAVMLPYLNMAIDELSESMEESNSSISNQTSIVIVVPKGVWAIRHPQWIVPGEPNYPDDLIEIQEIGERLSGTNDPFVRMTRVEYQPGFPPQDALVQWAWEDQTIKFNNAGTRSGPPSTQPPSGALTEREIQLRYIRQGVPYVVDADSVITFVNARSYLSYKTAAYCAMFIGENESRAQMLEGHAEKALERATSISNKGRQNIMTRHRPFRAGYKSRGGF